MLRILLAASVAALVASSAMARPHHRAPERAWAMETVAHPYGYGYSGGHYGGGFGGIPLGGGTATSPGGIP